MFSDAADPAGRERAPGRSRIGPSFKHSRAERGAGPGSFDGKEVDLLVRVLRERHLLNPVAPRTISLGVGLRCGRQPCHQASRQLTRCPPAPRVYHIASGWGVYERAGASGGGGASGARGGQCA